MRTYGRRSRQTRPEAGAPLEPSRDQHLRGETARAVRLQVLELPRRWLKGGLEIERAAAADAARAQAMHRAPERAHHLAEQIASEGEARDAREPARTQHARRLAQRALDVLARQEI